MPTFADLTARAATAVATGEPIGDKLKRAARALRSSLPARTPQQVAAGNEVMAEMREGQLWKRGIPMRDMPFHEAADAWILSESARTRLARAVRSAVDRLPRPGRSADDGRRLLDDALREAARPVRLQARPQAPPIRHRDVVDLIAAPHGPDAAGAMPAAA